MSLFTVVVKLHAKFSDLITCPQSTPYVVNLDNGLRINGELQPIDFIKFKSIILIKHIMENNVKRFRFII